MFFLIAVLAVLLTVAEAADVEYVIFPVDRKNLRQCSDTNRILESLGLGRVKRYDSAIREVTEFWLVEADPKQLPFVRRMQGVNDHSVLRERITIPDVEAGTPSPREQ